MPRTAKSDHPGGLVPTALDNMTVEPLLYDRAAGSQIFNAVKLAILRLEIPPGSLVSEAEVAARFGASRTPVREAFMQLRDAGLITTRPSRGNYVTKLSKTKTREARFIREAIELANIAHLCTHGLSPADREILEKNLAQQKTCLNNRHAIEFQKLDDQFHFTLARATGFPRIADLLEREKMNLDRLRVFSLKDQPHKEVLYQEHRQILNAVIAADTALATSLMRRHLSSILNTLSDMAEEHSEYFE